MIAVVVIGDVEDTFVDGDDDELVVTVLGVELTLDVFDTDDGGENRLLFIVAGDRI